MIYDMEGSTKYMSPVFTRVFGWSMEEMEGKRIPFVPDSEMEATMAIIKGLVENGTPCQGFETKRYNKNGQLLDVSISASRYDDHEGNPAGILTIHRDISERKRFEAQLQQAQKLEAIGILAGGIAHDFNNLLSVIMGNIELAEADIKPENGISEYLKEARKASLLAKELTKQLITFSKGGAPVTIIGPIGDLVKKSAYFTLSGSNVMCNFFISNDLWLVDFDVGQMTHALKNLIDNAVEAMPAGGSIDVGAENFEISSETVKRSLQLSEGKYVKISIRDQGVGIPEKDLSKIFDPYFSTKEMGTQKGVGLGLATTYSIINRHDGHITAESEAGVGTIFTLYLPAHEKDLRKIKPVETPKPEKPSIRTGKILVMDDEEMIRDIAKHILSRLGYEPELAKDGAEAIELYKSALDSGMPFDAVILDLTIKGGAGGKEVIKQLMEIDSDIKAIVSSGYSNDPVMTYFREYGFIGALPKPYTKKDLSDMLNQILGKS